MSLANKSVHLVFSMDCSLEFGKTLESFLDEQFWIIYQFFLELE